MTDKKQEHTSLLDKFHQQRVTIAHENFLTEEAFQLKLHREAERDMWREHYLRTYRTDFISRICVMVGILGNSAMLVLMLKLMGRL